MGVRLNATATICHDSRIIPGSLNRVPASAGVKAGKSPLIPYDVWFPIAANCYTRTFTISFALKRIPLAGKFHRLVRYLYCPTFSSMWKNRPHHTDDRNEIIITLLELHLNMVLIITWWMLSLLFGGTFVILFREYVYFTFCFYVFDMSSVVSYFTALLWVCAALLA